MSIINVEIKAKCNDPQIIREILSERNAIFKGTDNQKDTYFKVNNGRMKMREGNIEYSLVYYNREDISGPKKSDVLYYHPRKEDLIKKQLEKAIGTLVVVDKKREIYYIDNIKFHIDEVENLGSFVEIEAIDKTGNIGLETLYKQCKQYLELFKIKSENLLNNSYSDMLLEHDVNIKQGSIKQAFEVSKNIPEFNVPYDLDEYKKRLTTELDLILIAYWKGEPAGFKVGYKIKDHFYSWMGGVIPEFRNKGIARKLAQTQQRLVKEHSIEMITMKTRNKHINMLLFALSDGFQITGFEKSNDKSENRILLTKTL